MKAWHFSNGYLGYGDDRKIEAGITYLYDGPKPPELCCRGMHGSMKALDAIRFIKGCIVSRVEITGELQEGHDKVVGRERRVLWCADATEVLRKFARLCALDVVHLWDAPDVVVRYLKTGDESIRVAARTATFATAAYADAAATAAEAAVAAANAEAAYSAYATAYTAADAAAYSAYAYTATTFATAAEAARLELRKKQNRRLTRMLNELNKEKTK